MARILIIDDNETMREGMLEVVEDMGHEVTTADGGAGGIARFKEESPDFVISDLKMEEVTGVDVLRAVKRMDPEALVMIVTAYGAVDVAVEAMQEGAFDFITKPFSPAVLRAKVEKALQVRTLRRSNDRLTAENALLREASTAKVGAGDMVGESPAIARTLETVGKVAGTDSSVLVTGESGTGKELVAHALHRHSPRREGPFIKVNCGALAETLLESELFGHEKGSFTGALRRKLGRFELADGGTIFLDEIGDVSAAIQLKLLRVLQEREFERVGGEGSIRVDVRVVAATNKDLMEECRAGRFREDLYYRLCVVPIHLPPLRDRRSDIPLLVEHFLDKLRGRTRRDDVAGIADEAMTRLSAYDWPGNVRELENVVERAMVFASGDTVQVEDLPPAVAGSDVASLGGGLNLPPEDVPLNDVLEDLERQLIARALERAMGVKTEAARMLGLKTSALYYKLDKYGLGQISGRDEEGAVDSAG